MNDILAEIKRICDEAAERAATTFISNATEIKTDANILSNITSLLNEAKQAKKHSYAVYEQYKSRLPVTDMTTAQYENAIRDLAFILSI